MNGSGLPAWPVLLVRFDFSHRIASVERLSRYQVTLSDVLVTMCCVNELLT